MRLSTILYAVVLLLTPAFTLPLDLVTPVVPASEDTVKPVGGPTSKNTVRPVSGPTSEDTVRPPSGLTGKKVLTPLSGFSGKVFSEQKSGTPEAPDPAKLGLNMLEMDLEMNP